MLGDCEADGLRLGDSDGDIDGEGIDKFHQSVLRVRDVGPDGDAEGLAEGDSLMLGERLGLVDGLRLGDCDGD